MSLDYRVYIGPYAVCSVPRGGCLIGAREWLEEHGERLHDAENNYGPIVEGEHFFVPNESDYRHAVSIDPIDDESTRHEMPDGTIAVLAFEFDFSAELAMLREHFVSVEVSCGIIHWAW